MSPRPSMRTIQHVACLFYRVSRAELMSARREARIVRARQVAMYLARDLTMATWPQIGAAFCRDHSTVIHGTRRIAALVATDPEICAQVDFLQDRLLDAEAMQALMAEAA